MQVATELVRFAHATCLTDLARDHELVIHHISKTLRTIKKHSSISNGSQSDCALSVVLQEMRGFAEMDVHA